MAELKGLAARIPNASILIQTLSIQGAKDSSAIENIVTTHDELLKHDGLPEEYHSPSAKEVQCYRQALHIGYQRVQQTGMLTLNHILAIQQELEQNMAGFRKLPGTTLQNAAGEWVWMIRIASVRGADAGSVRLA